MRKVLSIDVGIKNLAMCIIEKKEENNNIILWENFNLLNDTIEKCKFLTKQGKICNSKCNYHYHSSQEKIFSCKKHCPKDNKVKIIQIKNKKVKNYSLQELTKIIISKLNQILEENKDHFENLEQIFIELQPKANPKMKLVSHIIFTKLVEYNIDNSCKIKFLQAKKKLSSFKKEEKNTYSKRKKLSIEYTKNIIEIEHPEWLNTFLESSKKDDLSDTFLMVYNYF